MAGAVILMSPAHVAGIDVRTLTVTPSGRVYDRRRQRYLDAEVVELPTAQRTKAQRQRAGGR